MRTLYGAGAMTKSEYVDYIRNGAEMYAQIVFAPNGNGPNIVLTNDVINLATGIVFTDVFNGENNLSFGNTVMRQVQIDLLDIGNTYNIVRTHKEFSVRIYTSHPNHPSMYVKYGPYIVKEVNIDKASGTISLTGYDYMSKFDLAAKGFIKSIKYPVSFTTLLSSLCRYVSNGEISPLSSDDRLANMANRVFDSLEFEENISCRDIISLMAQACGCNATITENKKLKFSWFTKVNDYSETSNYIFNQEFKNPFPSLRWYDLSAMLWSDIAGGMYYGDEAKIWEEIVGSASAYTYDSVNVYDSEKNATWQYPLNNIHNPYVITDNPFLAINSSQDVFDYILPIYDRISRSIYEPFSTECQGYGLIEAGDILNIEYSGTMHYCSISKCITRWGGAAPFDLYESEAEIDSAYKSSEIVSVKQTTSKQIQETQVQINDVQTQVNALLEPIDITSRLTFHQNITAVSGKVYLIGKLVVFQIRFTVGTAIPISDNIISNTPKYDSTANAIFPFLVNASNLNMHGVYFRYAGYLRNQNINQLEAGQWTLSASYVTNEDITIE